MDIREELFAAADTEYAAFQAKLAPTVGRDRFIGVRLPALRRIEREFEKLPECAGFISSASLPHFYYDENLLHSIIISRTKDFDVCIGRLSDFLPYVDNWAVCDTLRPKVFERHRDELLPHVKRWIASCEVYTCRFGIDMLMTHYLDDGFSPEYPELAAVVRSDEYYVQMMQAWYFATALSKRWDDVISFLTDGRLSDTVRRMTVRKALDSYRITDEQKRILKSLVSR